MTCVGSKFLDSEPLFSDLCGGKKIKVSGEKMPNGCISPDGGGFGNDPHRRCKGENDVLGSALC